LNQPCLRYALDFEQASGQIYVMDQSQSMSERSWAAIWREAGRELEVIRHREIKCVDTKMAILSLGDAFESALLHHPFSISSGMVEMQRLFGRVSGWSG
jgi:hypothetical protein